MRRLIELLKELRDGKYTGTRLVIERTLSPSEYRELRARVEAGEKLEGFFTKSFGEYPYVVVIVLATITLTMS